MPKQWLVSEYLNFQMVKFSKDNDKSLAVGQNQSLSIGDEVLIRIIPNKNMNVSFELQNKSKTTIVKNNFTLIKGKEILLPESIASSQKTFKVKGPAKKESFVIKGQDNKIFFRFNYIVK